MDANGSKVTIQGVHLYGIQIAMSKWIQRANHVLPSSFRTTPRQPSPHAAALQHHWSTARLCSSKHATRRAYPPAATLHDNRHLHITAVLCSTHVTRWPAQTLSVRLIEKMQILCCENHFG
ncbi:hypothetical protein M9H77_22598 [Catharanthus roseus]|uniref:Uncharacterized protein n=1 Tax=Catharanthus roseus TaxID=4058 RepID=A0ACC0ASL6_CATRO|nr:hypothetical protein M9H77_22598 [Catharanthus roseus]